MADASQPVASETPRGSRFAPATVLGQGLTVAGSGTAAGTAVASATDDPEALRQELKRTKQAISKKDLEALEIRKQLDAQIAANEALRTRIEAEQARQQLERKQSLAQTAKQLADGNLDPTTFTEKASALADGLETDVRQTAAALAEQTARQDAFDEVMSLVRIARVTTDSPTYREIYNARFQLSPAQFVRYARQLIADYVEFAHAGTTTDAADDEGDDPTADPRKLEAAKRRERAHEEGVLTPTRATSVSGGYTTASRPRSFREYREWRKNANPEEIRETVRTALLNQLNRG